MTRNTKFNLTWCGILFLRLFFESYVTGIPYRAAYQYGFSNAYSATVELPSYQIIDLGKGYTPMAVNDRSTVIMWGEGNRLVRWTCGEHELLWENFVDSSEAFLNEEGVVAAFPRQSTGRMDLVCWHQGSTEPNYIQWDPNLLEALVSARLFCLNDLGDLLLQTESMSANFPLPPAELRYSTSSVSLDTMLWSSVAEYGWNMEMDFSLHQSGEIYEISDSNNLGDTVGELYADSAVTPPMGEKVYFFQEEYFAYDKYLQLGFEPFQINDARTILGKSPGPQSGLIIVDSFGQRQLGPTLPELNSLVPSMSNPSDGMEEIVLGNRYWKRMVERNLTGHPTGQPAPDFHAGLLDGLVSNASGWSGLEATCISANGRIAGTGMFTNPVTGSSESHGWLFLPGAIVPDWDRSGGIDDRDRQLLAMGEPWRFWINDDDDQGELARSSLDDISSSNNPDFNNPGVDGLRDVVDFFSVLLDLQKILQALPDTSQIDITLSHRDSALNFAYSNLLPDEVGQLHSNRLTSGFGPDFTFPLESAPTHPLGPDPTSLSAAFIENIRKSNQGVILLEGTGPTTQPLEMVILRNGIPVTSYSLPLSISPVRDMFRIVNLRQADPKFLGSDPGPWGTKTSQPPNLPDSWLVNILQPLRTLINIHGYNCGGTEITASHSEVFKRFFQSGSNARFIGVSWFGNQGELDLFGTTFDYNENVANAFITARYASESLLSFSGPFTSLFAHSLGNVVASSAILDFGLDVGSYFMANAAVPNEAYLGEQAVRRNMVHPYWKDRSGDIPDYDEFLLSANWFRLFPSSDRRSALKWKNRFKAVSSETICFNFYSSGEDILAPGNGELPALFGTVWNREQIWTYNEMVKGTTALTSSLTGETHAGWGFSRFYMDWLNPGGGAHPPEGYWEPMSPGEAQLISPENCILHPFFREFSTNDADYPSWDSGSWLYEDASLANAHLPAWPYTSASTDNLKNHARILAEAIPAHSPPAGSTTLPSVLLLRNFNVDALFRDPNNWPIRDAPDKRDRWLHSDYLNPSLSQVGRLYRECVKRINYKP